MEREYTVPWRSAVRGLVFVAALGTTGFVGYHGAKAEQYQHDLSNYPQSAQRISLTHGAESLDTVRIQLTGGKTLDTVVPQVEQVSDLLFSTFPEKAKEINQLAQTLTSSNRDAAITRIAFESDSLQEQNARNTAQLSASYGVEANRRNAAVFGAIPLEACVFLSTLMSRKNR